MYAGIIEGSKMANVSRRNRGEGRQVWVGLGANRIGRQRTGVMAGRRRGAEWEVGTLGPLALGRRGLGELSPDILVQGLSSLCMMSML